MHYLKTCQQILDSEFIKNKYDSELAKFELGLEQQAHQNLHQFKGSGRYHQMGDMFFIPAKSPKIDNGKFRQGF